MGKTPKTEPNSLFFIAILPNQAIQDEITAIKQSCSELFNLNYALKTLPHITLIPPFRSKLTQVNEIKRVLQDFSKTQKQFEIKLNGFGKFSTRVIFIDVIDNLHLDNLQEQLHKRMKECFKIGQKHGNLFNPHITVAHRDLQTETFPSAWHYFSNKEYKRNFTADNISLLQHIEGRWELVSGYDLNK